VAAPKSDQPPAEILMGPCIEVWAGEPDPPLSGGYAGSFSGPWRARRNWRKAVDEWAESVGLEHWEAHNLSRSRHPWSRNFLLSIGGESLVDYLEGRRGDWPGYPAGMKGPYGLAGPNSGFDPR